MLELLLTRRMHDDELVDDVCRNIKMLSAILTIDIEEIIPPTELCGRGMLKVWADLTLV